MHLLPSGIANAQLALLHNNDALNSCTSLVIQINLFNTLTKCRMNTKSWKMQNNPLLEHFILWLNFMHSELLSHVWHCNNFNNNLLHVLQLYVTWFANVVSSLLIVLTFYIKEDWWTLYFIVVWWYPVSDPATVISTCSLFHTLQHQNIGVIDRWQNQLGTQIVITVLP